MASQFGLLFRNNFPEAVKPRHEFFTHLYSQLIELPPFFVWYCCSHLSEYVPEHEIASIWKL